MRLSLTVLFVLSIMTSTFSQSSSYPIIDLGDMINDDYTKGGSYANTIIKEYYFQSWRQYKKGKKKIFTTSSYDKYGNLLVRQYYNYKSDKSDRLVLTYDYSVPNARIIKYERYWGDSTLKFVSELDWKENLVITHSYNHGYKNEDYYQWFSLETGLIDSSSCPSCESVYNRVYEKNNWVLSLRTDKTTRKIIDTSSIRSYDSLNRIQFVKWSYDYTHAYDDDDGKWRELKYEYEEEKIVATYKDTLGNRLITAENLDCENNIKYESVIYYNDKSKITSASNNEYQYDKKGRLVKSIFRRANSKKIIKIITYEIKEIQ